MGYNDLYKVKKNGIVIGKYLTNTICIWFTIYFYVNGEASGTIALMDFLKDAIETRRQFSSPMYSKNRNRDRSEDLLFYSLLNIVNNITTQKIIAKTFLLVTLFLMILSKLRGGHQISLSSDSKAPSYATDFCRYIALCVIRLYRNVWKKYGTLTIRIKKLQLFPIGVFYLWRPNT